MFTPYSFHVRLLITAPATALSGLPSYTTRRGNLELLQVQVQVLTSANIPLHVPSGDLIPESPITSTSHWDWLRGWCGASGAYRCPRWSTAVVVLRAEPLITPILTATAGRHAVVAAARAVVRGGAERGGTGAGATPGGSAGGVGSAWTWSGSPAVVQRARLQGLVVAADAPTAFQHVQPLLQAADDLVQLPGLAPGDVQMPLGGGGDVGALDHLDLGDVQLSLCAEATLAMRVISPLPVSTSRSRDWTLLRR